MSNDTVFIGNITYELTKMKAFKSLEIVMGAFNTLISPLLSSLGVSNITEIKTDNIKENIINGLSKVYLDNFEIQKMIIDLVSCARVKGEPSFLNQELADIHFASRADLFDMLELVYEVAKFNGFFALLIKVQERFKKTETKDTSKTE